MKLSDAELQQLAAQLSNPKGEKGIQVAEMMNFTNSGLISKAIELLNITNENRILEIGPGNGSHVGSIIKNENTVYYGIDISETMIAEAKK